MHTKGSVPLKWDCYFQFLWFSQYITSKHLFEINNRNTKKRCETCSKLTIKTPEWRQCEICSKLTIKTPEQRRSDIFIVNFESRFHTFC